MDILNNLQKLKDLEKKEKYYAYWTLQDDCSQSSLSTTSLSQDVDELRFIDDDSASSSSDEVYSLETSMIEMDTLDEKASTENNENCNKNQRFQHASSPMIPRSSNFYDNDTFTDDTILQLSNKGFAQSLGKQAFVQNHSKPTENPTISKGFLSHLKDGKLFDSYLSNSVNKKNTKETYSLHHKMIATDCWLERSFDSDALDNEDLISISSHGSDRSTTPVDMRPNASFADESPQKAMSEINRNEDSNLKSSTPKHFVTTHVHSTKPRILQFTDSEDIGSLSPEDEIHPFAKTSFDEDDEDDKSTICESEHGDKEDNETNSSNDVFQETIYHQPPKAADRSAAKRLAKRLYQLNGFKMSDVSKHLSKRNDFSQLVGEEFANFFDFAGNTLDVALRKFLEKFILCGDTQERERVIHHFSRRFVQCNPNVYNCEEACHTLVCALMLLNTDLHGNSINRKMTCDDFVISMAELNNGENFDREELIMLFNSILEKPIRWNVDNELIGLFQPKIDYNDINKQIHTNHLNLFLEVPSEATSKEYMSGYLLRKCIKESHFRRTSIGKRGWKLYFGKLQDLTLHLYKDEISVNGSLKRSFKKKGVDNDLRKSGNSHSDPILTQINNKTELASAAQLNGNSGKVTRKSPKFPVTDKNNYVSSQPASEKPITKSNLQNMGTESMNSNVDLGSSGDTNIFLNHAFASKATDYSKKRNVFRLQVSNGSEYLFQVNEPREVELWVDCLNFVAALLSPPVFSSNASSKDSLNSTRNKSNPTLTSLNIKEQLENHQRCVLNLEQELINLSSKPSCKSDKTKLKWQYSRQRKFIEKELLRYKTYARLLEFEMIHLHNMTIARLSQQAFMDPYLVPVQYSQIPGSSPLFYNYQTNQFLPAINCVSTIIPVFQYHPNYTIPPGSINNSIKELSEENNSQGLLDSQNPINIQPVIIRPTFTCTRNSRSQLGVNKRRRYRNIPTQQQLVMQYPPPLHLQNSQNTVYGSIVPAHTSSSIGAHDNKILTLHHQSVHNNEEATSPKSSGNLTPNKQQSVPSLINIQQTNGANNISSNSRTFYEIL